MGLIFAAQDAQVQAGGGACAVEQAERHDDHGHHGGDRLAGASPGLMPSGI
jgi:hypothetical protein